jgi:hypothetical protein
VPNTFKAFNAWIVENKTSRLKTKVIESFPSCRHLPTIRRSDPASRNTGRLRPLEGRNRRMVESSLFPGLTE